MRPNVVNTRLHTSTPAGTRQASETASTVSQPDRSSLHDGNIKPSSSRPTGIVLSTTASTIRNSHYTDGKSWAQVAAGDGILNSPTPTPTAKPKYPQTGHMEKSTTKSKIHILIIARIKA